MMWRERENGSYLKGRLCTVDLLIEVACFVTKVKLFYLKIN
jgi:hypothetical protein